MGQEKPQIKEGFPLSDASVVSNVATNEELKSMYKTANVDGKDIEPNTVTARHLATNDATISGTIRGGQIWVDTGGVTIASSDDSGNGLVMGNQLLQLISNSVVKVSLNGADGTASFSGTLDACTLNSATLNTGTIQVGTGGVTISGGAGGSGIQITGNQIYCNVGGETTFSLKGSDGSAYFKGQVVTSNLQLTGSATNNVDLTTGTVYLGTGVVIGPVGTGTRTAGDLVRHFSSPTIDPPTVADDGVRTGDMWLDTTVYKLYTWDGDSWEQNATRVTTFAQDNVPTSLAVGDIWCDTNDGNKMYRAESIGANEVKAGEWVAVQDAGISTAMTNAATALGLAATAQETADGQIVGWYQNNAPVTGMSFGDIWIDTDDTPVDSSSIYRYQDAYGGSQGTLAWRAAPTNAIGLVYLNDYATRAIANSANSQATSAYNLAGTKITTFYQDNVPTALTIGDMWVDTNDGNKLYRAFSLAANEIKTGEWQLEVGQTAVQPGNGFGVDATTRQPNSISLNTSGIEIYTASTGARLLLNNNGLSAKATISGTAKDVVTLDSTNGIRVVNYSATPGVAERVSVCYNNGSTTKEAGFFGGYSASARLVAPTNYELWMVGAEGVEISSGDYMRLATDDPTKSLALGDDTYPWASVTVHGDMILASGHAVRAVHKSADGSTKANSSFSFYAASSSGGSPTVKHTVTFEDGLIVSWSAA